MLDRYLARTLLVHTIFALGGLTFLIALFSFVEQQDDVGQGQYTVALAALHTLLLLPSWTADLVAVAVLLGTLTGFGRLQQDSEITAMRAAGYSVARVIVVATAVACAVASGSMLLAEIAAPGLEQMADRIKTESRFGTSVSTSREAWWTRDGLRILHVERDAASSGRITVFDLDQGELLRSITTTRTAYDQGKNTILLQDALSTTYLEERSLSSGPEDVAIVSQRLSALLKVAGSGSRSSFESLPALASRARVILSAGLDPRMMRYEVNARLARFTIAPLLAAIAILGSLTGIRAARQGARLMIGLIGGLALSLLRDVAQSAVLIFGWPAGAAAWLPVAASIAVLGVMRLRDARRIA